MYRARQKGFTLIELVVVIAILGVLAAVAVPLVTNYLGSAKQRAFTADQQRIQAAVDAYYSAPDNTRFIGKRQYPVLGRSQTTQASLTTATSTQSKVDDGNSTDGGSAELWNPVGGTQGADLSDAAIWTDGDSDGTRTSSTSTNDRWASVSVTRNAVTYHTDSRYFFVDLQAIVDAGLLSDVPDSAAPDNATGATGSYIWYVDDDGKVQAMYRHFPDSKGYQSGVYP